MRVRRRVTLLDVARAAGVSRTTASYVLNGRTEMRISADAHERVRRAADRLGYRPNRNALSLRTATSMTFGMVTDFVSSGQASSQMISGASLACLDSGHLLLIGETEGDPLVERRLIEEMIDRQVDGILYATLVSSQVQVPAPLAGCRTVLLNCRDRDGETASVMPDDFGGGRAAARVLLDAGHRDRVFVVGEEITPGGLSGAARLSGVRTELSAAGAEVADVVACEWAVVPAYESVSKWLSTGVRPAALVCLNDRVAMGTYQAIGEFGLDVPADVSVVSFDASELAGWLRPTLTSVEVPYAHLGRQAVHALMRPEPLRPGVRAVAMPVRRGGSVRPGVM